MDEISLVRDALQQLDELFLLVVVGEFNSGKSSIVNALLGGRFLAEGILPTTNEISVLKWGCVACPCRSTAFQSGLFAATVLGDLHSSERQR